ncbi:MAG: hypothetical protein K1V90_04860 [Muribaculaceae bacterium]
MPRHHGGCLHARYITGGKVVETGNHDSLIERKGAYYNLVKNQLELGK